MSRNNKRGRFLTFLWVLFWQTKFSNQQSCPSECMCISPTQVMCNSGGLREIPSHRLPHTVEELSLSKNAIGTIWSEVFSRYVNLTKLKLDYNNITKINRFAFRGLPNLKELSIQHSSLTQLDRFSFSGLKNVSDGIYLSHNKLTYIDEFTFAGLSNVKLIDLTDNPIVKLRSNAFSGLQVVGQLILPNGIRSVEADVFNGLDNVNVLKLAFMDLKQLNGFTFRGLNRVLLLSIQESDLGVILANAFAEMSQIDSLNIINNKIDHMEEFVIRSDQRVRIVRFVGNHLLRVPNLNAILVDPIDNFTVVGNHFFCDCRVHDLLSSPLANRTSSDFSARNYCISPPPVKGKQIRLANLDRIGTCNDDYFGENWRSVAANDRLTLLNLLNRLLSVVLLINLSL